MTLHSICKSQTNNDHLSLHDALPISIGRAINLGNLTFGIIKPDAVGAGNAGNIIQRINDAGFKLRGMKTLHMRLKEDKCYYESHRELLCRLLLNEYMSSAPCVVMVLE